ncbi:MAG: single-stranded DNA-binding protein [Bacteroides sp.]
MASGDVNITVVGNVVADPELRFTSTGAAVATFRVASTPRRYDSQSGQWVDGEALFLTCNVWRQVAENIAETLTKGMRVIVTGRLRSRSYDTQNGDRRTVMELEVDEVGPSLRYATAQVTRNPRGDSPMVMSARVVFVATWRAAPRFRCRVAIRLLPFRKAFRCLKNVSIKHLQLFEDRSDAAHRVVQKRAQTPHPI